MRTRYDAAIDGYFLSWLDPAIYVLDIRESAPAIRRTTANAPTGDGQRVLCSQRQYLRVTVDFEIHTQDIRARQEICQRVQAWAQGRYLTVNTRERQRLRVLCETQPVVTSALKWTDPLSVTFAAYELPYWEDLQETRVHIPSGQWFTSWHVPGTARATLCEVTVSNVGSSPVTAMTLAAGDSRLIFAGISLPTGGTFALSYSDELTLSARIGETSVLAARTTESDDDLLAPCGQDVTFIAQASGNTLEADFRFRGLYL